MRAVVAIVGLSLCASLGSGAGVAQSATPSAILAPSIKLDRAAWAASIASARLRSPASFTIVGAVRGQLLSLDAHKRGPLAPIPARLQGLGKDAVEALAEQLLNDDTTLPESARTAWRAGILETLGALRDPRTRELAAPLLDDPDYVVARAAAEAIGKLGDDAAVIILAPRIAAQQKSAIDGSCRRRGIASALAGVVAARPSTEIAKVTAKALGELGASWAWKTGKVPAPAEEHDVRSMAARSLIALFVGYDGEVRLAASNALMVVDDPSTPALIAAAKSSASSDTIAALDSLAARFGRNPAR
jgi:hypothetical protein